MAKHITTAIAIRYRKGSESDAVFSLEIGSKSARVVKNVGSSKTLRLQAP